MRHHAGHSRGGGTYPPVLANHSLEENFRPLFLVPYNCLLVKIDFVPMERIMFLRIYLLIGSQWDRLKDIKNAIVGVAHSLSHEKLIKNKTS